MVRRRAQAGFTLTELAITTAGVAVVFMIAGSLLRSWQEKEQKKHTCQPNMRQLGLAITQYALDADGEFPAGVNARGNGWAGQLYQYVKSTSIYRCPYDEHQGSYISYAENQNLVRGSSNKLADPSTTVVFYEFTTLNCAPSAPETVSATGLDAPQNSTRHDDKTFGLNFVLADGHVKSLIPGQVSGGANAVSPKTLSRGGVVATFAVQ